MLFTTNILRYFYFSLFLIALGIIFGLAYGPHYSGVLPCLLGGVCGLIGCFLNKVYNRKRA